MMCLLIVETQQLCISVYACVRACVRARMCMRALRFVCVVESLRTDGQQSSCMRVRLN